MPRGRDHVGHGTSRSQLEAWVLSHAGLYAAQRVRCLGIYPDEFDRVFPSTADVQMAFQQGVRHVSWVINHEDVPGAPGDHWVCLGVSRDPRRAGQFYAWMADSFGSATDADLNRLLWNPGTRHLQHFSLRLSLLLRSMGEHGDQRILHVPVPLQPITSDTCGEWALAFSVYGPPPPQAIPGAQPHRLLNVLADVFNNAKWWRTALKGGQLASDRKIRMWAGIRSGTAAMKIPARSEASPDARSNSARRVWV